MSAKTTTVRKDLIPYRAGTVVLTPLDANMRPDYKRSVATEYTYLASTQTSVTRATETLESGNGSNKEIPTSETYTVTITANAFNPVFHNAAAGRLETLPNTTLMKDEFTFNLASAPAEEGGYLQITFGSGKDHEVEPAADADGNYNFVVEDSYGNPLMRLDTPQFGAYSYDEEANALQFSKEYANAAIRVIYNYEEPNALVYKSDPILKISEFRLEIFGITQSAGGGESYKVETILERCSVTGDLSEPPTQAARSAPMTYTFASTPVPAGVSVYTQKFAPVSTGGTGTGSSSDNIVNGGDDKFTTTPGA